MAHRSVHSRLGGLALLLLAPFAGADYLAYAVGEKAQIPLPERIDKIDAKYLLNVKWGDYAGSRSRVAVLEVDNNSSSQSFSVSGPGGQTYSWRTL